MSNVKPGQIRRGRLGLAAGSLKSELGKGKRELASGSAGERRREVATAGHAPKRSRGGLAERPCWTFAYAVRAKIPETAPERYPGALHSGRLGRSKRRHVVRAQAVAPPSALAGLASHKRGNGGQKEGESGNLHGR